MALPGEGDFPNLLMGFTGDLRLPGDALLPRGVWPLDLWVRLTGVRGVASLGSMGMGLLVRRNLGELLSPRGLIEGTTSSSSTSKAFCCLSLMKDSLSMKALF